MSKLDFTKPGTAEEKYDARVHVCSECGRRGLVVEDPLIEGRNVYIHKATSKKGVLMATDRCEIQYGRA